MYSALARVLIPPLSWGYHKGQHGCIAVIGGCLEYCGAPYYAAISALKTGADLSHVFCTEDAAIPIKAFSPELIVHPVLPSHKEAQEASRQDEFMRRSHESFKLWLPRMSALIVGPGLGRDPAVLACAAVAIQEAASLSIPIVIDADGLFLLCQQPEILDGCRHVVLTPNTAELKRLIDSLKIVVDESHSLSRYSDAPVSRKAPVSPETVGKGLALSARFNGVAVYCKGSTDVIVCQPPDGGEPIVVFSEEPGSPRRCGGQGDVASGCIATFLGWAKLYKKPHGSSIEPGLTCDKLVACAQAGSSLLRRAASIAFKEHHRATTTPDIIGKIGPGFSQLFDTEASPRL